MSAYSTVTVSRQWAEAQAIAYLSKMLATVSTATDTELEDMLDEVIGHENLNNYRIG